MLDVQAPWLYVEPLVKVYSLPRLLGHGPSVEARKKIQEVFAHLFEVELQVVVAPQDADVVPLPHESGQGAEEGLVS